jgi:hypothetical protein
MHLPSLARLGVVSLALIAGGCGGDKPEQQAASGNGMATPKGSGGKATTIHLVITGGPHAGTYDATSDNLTCTYGFAGPGSWGNQYSVTGKSPNDFSSLQLIVPDTKDAADGTDRFLVTAGFGDLLKPGYTEYTINTGAGIPGSSAEVKKEGSGTVTVADKGESGKVSFKGKTKNDVALEGTIDCHQVMRGEG